MQRRLAAVLFADIVGFTELSARDERGSLSAVHAFEESVRAAVSAQGGQVVKFMGDGALAHFPSTEASIRAGLALVQGFTEATGGQRRVRVGIHVGDILIRDDGDVLGEGVNTASRLQSVASPGEVVVSDEVWRQIRHLGDFGFRALGARQLKGVPERREVYVVTDGGDGVPMAAPKSRRRLAWIASAVTAAVVAFIVVRGLPPAEAPDTQVAPEAIEDAGVQSLVVLPFDDLSGDPEEAWLVSGMHDALIGELTDLSALRIISRTSAIRYRGTTLSLAEIARELNVEAVVAASVLRSGQNIRIRAELVRVFPQEESLWAGTYDREMQDVLALYSELAKALADAIHLRLTPDEEARFARGGSVDPDAYEAYLRGLFHWDRHTSADLDLAQRFFEQALAHDPDYAPAYGGIALTWLGRMRMRTVTNEEASTALRAAALRALELDPGLASAHQALASDYAFYRHDWDAAERHYLEMLDANPGYALGRAFYSLFLRITGRAEEALVQSARARRDDPFNPIVQAMHAGNLAQNGRLQDTLEVILTALEHLPGHPILLSSSYIFHHLFGNEDEALRYLRELYAVERDEVLAAALANGARDGGYRGALRAVAVEYERRIVEDGRPLYGHLSDTLIALREYEAAIVWLERAADAGDFEASYIGTYRFDALRPYPRFQALLARLGLP